MFESAIEQRARTEIIALGGLFLKFIPIRNGDPDRILLVSKTKISPAQAIFIEMKRPGEEPRKLQLYRHDELRKKGFKVFVCHSYHEVTKIYKKAAGIS